jgi:hypothetical protein
LGLAIPQLTTFSEETAISDHAIPTLLRKRKEIALIIDQKQGELVNMLSDLNALDCAIRLFDPDIELSEVIMRPLPPRDGAGRGQMSTTVLAILRTLSEPMKTEAIRDEVMKRRGLSLADRPLGRMMLGRVHSCLRAQRKRGIVRSQKVGKASAWEVAR